MTVSTNGNATGQGAGLALTTAQITAGATGVIGSDSSGNAYKQDGTAFSGGGGVTTYAALTDAATVNLPTVNTLLQTALAAKLPTTAIATTTALLKGDGAGNAVAATAAVDYAQATQVRCGIPIIVGTAGTVSANGALAITGAALTTAFAASWLWLPASAAFSGSAAGFYYTTFSSVTVGTVFNNVYTPGTNTGAGSFAIPASPTAIVGTGTAYTNTAETVMLQLTVPAGAMGVNGGARSYGVFLNNNNANNKISRIRYGTGNATVGASIQTTAAQSSLEGEVQSMGNASAQVLMIRYPTSATTPTYTTLATATTAENLWLATIAGTAGDWSVLQIGELAYYSAPV